MGKDFDPYLTWLSVAPEDQPANHYRLLGLPELIDDADAIESAADRQMAHVRTFASGQHAQISQRILNEISNAKICLLNPQEKLAYDQQLRAAAAAKAPSPPRAQPVLRTRQAVPQAQASQQSVPVAATPAVASHSTAAPQKSRSSGSQMIIAAGLIVVAVGLACGLYFATSGDPVVAEHEGEPETPTVPPTVEPPEKTPPVVDDSSGGPEKTPTKEPPTTTPEVEKPKPPASTQESTAPPTTGQSVDLLKQVDLARDVVEGDWKLEDGELVSPADGAFARVMIPSALPEEYQLTLEVERISGDNSLIVGLVSAREQIEAWFDYHEAGKPETSGLINDDRPPHRGAVLNLEKVNLLKIDVSGRRLTATVNGRTIFDSPRTAKMNVHPLWEVPRKDVLFLGCPKTSFRIRKFQLTSGSDAAMVASKPPQMAKPINLLERINPSIDSLEGDWKKEDGALVSPGDLPTAKVLIPVAVPQEYRLTLQLERLSGDNALVVGLIAEGKQLETYFDAHGIDKPPLCGFTNFAPSLTQDQLVLNSGASHVIEYHVGKARFVATVNDQIILDRPYDPRMGVHPSWAIARKDLLFLGSTNSSFRFSKLELIPLGDAAVVVANDLRPEASKETPTPEPATKLPLPYGQALEKAQATLSEVFKDDLAAAKTNKDRADLAKKLLVTSAEEGSDPVETYVMLRAARKLAARAGDAKTVLTAINQLDEQFAFDSLEMKAEALAEVAKSVRLPADQVTLATLAGGVVLEMVESDRFDLAEPLTKLVQTAATKSRDVQLRKEVAASVKQFGVLRDQFQKVQSSFEKLKEAPDDPEANLAVGRYRAFVRNDWPSGLANLAAGSDEALKALATQDLVGADSPGDQVNLGDAWWKLAEAEKGETQKAMKTRAGYWYGKAMPELTGLSKEKVSKRLNEIRQLDPTGRIELKDWEVRCWDGRWRSFPMSKMKTEFSGGVLNLTNTTGIHTHAWVVFRPFVAKRPFTATFEIRGEFRAIGLASEHGDDGHRHISSAKDGQWHVYRIQRTGDGEYRFALDGRPTKPTSHADGKSFDGQLGLTLHRENTCSIRRFDFHIDPK